MNTIGFTASQHGLTPNQSKTLMNLLALLKEKGFTRFKYGLCVGGDDEGAMIAGNIGYSLEAFPGDNPNKRGKVVAGITHKPEKNLDRNWKIAASDLLIACPKSDEASRSGTWSTVRRARKLGTSYIVIMPDGFMKGTLRRDGQIFVTTNMEDIW